MRLQFSVYHLPLLSAGVVSLLLAYFAARQRERRTAPKIATILGGAAVWAFADAARLATVDPTVKLLFHDLRFVGSTTLVWSTLLFALEYTNRERWMTRRHVAAYAVPFVVTLLLVATGHLFDHGLIRQSTRFVTVDGLRLAEFRFGTWFYVNALYSYLLLLVVLLFYVGSLRRERPGTYRRQTLALTVSLLIPWILNGLYLADLTVVDLTAVGILVTGAMHYVAIFWFDLLALVPIARSTVVDNVEHGVVVLDTDRRVVDVNEEMEALLGVPRRSLLGTPIADVETDLPGLVAGLSEDSDGRDLSIEVDGERREFELESSTVHSDRDRRLGRIVLVRDVTRARRREAALRERRDRLERQNERLDRFADVVSHDLRNPLTVARGYLEFAAEDPRPEHFERVEGALDRMDEIVEDVLALARQSTDLEATEDVDLARIAEEAWHTVDSAGATLDLRTDAHVDADRSRLQRLLENLFRNSMEHAPEGVTVTVGSLPGGFYVEDDGPGIPETDREQVFEHGYSTVESGTGFGLSIVAAIVDAHGWSIRVTDGSSGGARFEITGTGGTPESGDLAGNPAE